MKKIFTFLAIMTSLMYAKSQNPDYQVVLKNDVLVSPNVLEFDLYIKSIGSVPLEYSTFQAGIKMNPLFVNGGFPAIELIGNSSEMYQLSGGDTINDQRPNSGPVKAVFDTVYNTIRIISGTIVGAGNGKIISTSGDGNRIGRFRVINTENYDTLLAKFEFNYISNGSYRSWRTTLFAYVNSIGTNITDPNKIVVNDSKVVYVEPTSIASNASATNIQTTSMTINIGSNGNGQNILILAKKGSNPTFIPTDGDIYNASPSYSNAQLLTDSSRVVYEGKGNSFELIGLEESSKYFFTVFNYNGVDSTKNFLNSSSLTFNATTNSPTINTPIIYSFAPTKGDIGTPVTLRGNKLYPNDSVLFNSSKVAVSSNVGDSIITISIPSNELSGFIKVYTSFGSSSTNIPFTILPKILSINENPAKVGDTITISGTNFEGVDTVIVSNKLFKVLQSNNTTIKAIVTYNPTDDLLSVICKNGTITTTDNFRYKPQAFSVFPLIGTTNDPITIKGINLNNVDSVLIGNVKATILNVYPDTNIKISIPPFAVKSKVYVYTKNGIATTVDSLNIISGLNELSLKSNIISYFDIENNLTILSENNRLLINQVDLFDLKGSLLYTTKEDEKGIEKITIPAQDTNDLNFFVMVIKTNQGYLAFKKIKQ
jgi:hypothetical protein